VTAERISGGLCDAGKKRRKEKRQRPGPLQKRNAGEQKRGVKIGSTLQKKKKGLNLTKRGLGSKKAQGRGVLNKR